MARTLVLFALAAALVTPAWLGVAEPNPPLGDVLPMVLLALGATLAAALVRRLAVRALAVAALTVGAAASAFDIPLTNARPGAPEHDFVGPVLGAVREGFRDFYDVRIPFDAVAHWQMGGLVLLAVFGFVAVTGVLIAARRPLAAASALLVGVAWPATMSAAWVPGTRPLVTGAATLVAFLAFLYLLGRERVRGAAQAAAFATVLAVAAVLAATTDAVAKPAFLEWERWDLYDRPAPPVSVRYVWDANYDGISFPEKATVVLKVRVPSTSRSLYWRATTLDEYTGFTWRESLHLGDRTPADTVDVTALDAMLPRSAQDDERWIRQDVTVEALEDNHLIGSAQPVRWDPGVSGPAQVAANGVVVLPEGLSRGQRYSVWSYVPRLSARALARVPAEYPESLSRYLEVLPGVEAPPFGAPAREDEMRDLFGERFGDFVAHERLYLKALAVVGEAESPYAAAASLETWLRSEGGFIYDESPPARLNTEPPLPYFVLTSKRGYCQQYAGAMAVMLRLLGVPARVAAGFTSGDYDERNGEWTVTDRNAHTWVEVYFPGHGWLPFDPTPGRGALSAPYSAASPDFDPRAAAAAFFRSELLDQIDFSGAEGGGRSALEERERFSAEPAGGAARGAAEAGRNILGPIFLLAALALLAVVVAKALYRALRLARRDSRALASACRRDVVGFLVDQRVEVPESATLTEVGRLVEGKFGVDAGPFVRTVTAARFAPPASGARAARRTRRELGRLRRALRRRLTLASRVRGALSVRSLVA